MGVAKSEEAHLRCTCVKDAGNWMGWTDWKGWTGFLRESGETLWTAVGSSWFRLMICRASWVFPEDTQHRSTCLFQSDHTKTGQSNNYIYFSEKVFFIHGNKLNFSE